jgi:hypothetical protein
MIVGVVFLVVGILGSSPVQPPTTTDSTSLETILLHRVDELVGVQLDRVGARSCWMR